MKDTIIYYNSAAEGEFMKVVQLNATCGVGSTGKICVSISKLLNKQGIENYILYTDGNSDYEQGIKYAGKLYTKIQALKSRVLGNYGFNSGRATKRLIGELDRIAPDIVHLHNIHSHNVNLGTLFEYLKKKKIKVVYTFHDCWAFTGGCMYFIYNQCEGWKNGCGNCPTYRKYSCFFDRSVQMLAKRKRVMNGLDMTIVTPSVWLAELAKESILRDYPIYTINNGINLNVFKPTASDFRKKNRIRNKMILGVSFGWENRKGLDIFVELANRLPDDYSIVLVGTDDMVDKQLPERILSIHRTNNQAELAEIYSAADVFVNPTREDNYPTVNMEALACGTPVVTFNVGGSAEMLDETCGRSVAVGDVEKLICCIEELTSDETVANACLNKRADFDEFEKFRSYVELYKSLSKD